MWRCLGRGKFKQSTIKLEHYETEYQILYFQVNLPSIFFLENQTLMLEVLFNIINTNNKPPLPVVESKFIPS